MNNKFWITLTDAILGLLGKNKTPEASTASVASTPTQAPAVVPTEPTFPKITSQKDAEMRYGDIVGGKWLGERTWMAVVPLPEIISKRLITVATGGATTKVYCNID